LINLTGGTLFFVDGDIKKNNDVILTIPPTFEKVDKSYSFRRENIESTNLRERNEIGGIPLIMVNSIQIPNLNPTNKNTFYIVEESVAFAIYQVDLRMDVLFPCDIQRIFWNENNEKVIHYKSLAFVHHRCGMN
jgi:hypothetical protein